MNKPEIKLKISDSQKKLWEDPEYRRKHSELNNLKEKREKISNSVKKLWKNSEYAKKITKAQNRKPNNTEIMLGGMLDDITQKSYLYTGDGQVIINGICPDFTKNDGSNKVIELFGDHWHKGEDPQKRISRFAKHGYNCLVIWEHELWEKPLDKLIEKIIKFDKEVYV